jgi:hypothetical protein
MAPISLSSSALERSSLTAADVLALTSEPAALDLLDDPDDESDALPYVAGEEPEVQLIPLNGASTIIYTSQEVDRYMAMWNGLNGRGSEV